MRTVLIDKIILFLACCLVCIVFFNGKYTPALLCIALSYSGGQFIDNNNKRKIVYILLFVFLCVFFEGLISFIPLALYDGLFIKPLFINLTFIIPLAYNFQMENYLYIIIFAGIFYSLVANQKTKKILFQSNEFKTYRDDTVEIKRILEEKNRQLIINQDYEIKMAALNERDRISKELHDSIGHLISRSLIHVGALTTISSEEPVKEGLDKLKESLSQGMDAIRETIHDMHYSAFDLDSKIREVVKDFDFCEVVLDYYILCEPEMEMKYAFVSIIKESLSNIMKHSEATNVYITVGELPSIYQLVINDNGLISEMEKQKINRIVEKAFNKEGNLEMGLTGIIERVLKFGGRINITADKGMKIFISIPKKQNVEE